MYLAKLMPFLNRLSGLTSTPFHLSPSGGLRTDWFNGNRMLPGQSSLRLSWPGSSRDWCNPRRAPSEESSISQYGSSWDWYNRHPKLSVESSFRFALLGSSGSSLYYVGPIRCVLKQTSLPDGGIGRCVLDYSLSLFRMIFLIRQRFRWTESSRWRMRT